jgi:hypothetical protein
VCWNFGGTGASSHTEYKITTLTFEAVSVFQTSQFGACPYSLWKAKFNGKKKKKHGCLKVGSLKMFSEKYYYLWSQYEWTQPTPIIKVTHINPGGVTVRCVILTLFQLSDTFLGLMCT